jgi:hypothetical protein
LLGVVGWKVVVIQSNKSLTIGPFLRMIATSLWYLLDGSYMAIVKKTTRKSDFDRFAIKAPKLTVLTDHPLLLKVVECSNFRS